MLRYLENNHCTYPSKDLLYWNTHTNPSASKQHPVACRSSITMFNCTSSLLANCTRAGQTDRWEGSTTCTSGRTPDLWDQRSGGIEALTLQVLNYMNSKPFHCRDRTSFLPPLQITSNLHYHYYVDFSSRISTFKKSSYCKGSVLDIDSNPLPREAAEQGPKDDRLAPLRLLSYNGHKNFQSTPKKLLSPLKCQLPKFLLGKCLIEG